MQIIHALATGVALAIAFPATAGGFEEPAAIDREVAQFTGAPIGGQGGAILPVDRRLKLAQCPMPLALEWYGRTNQTVLVRCPIAGGWRIFVPVGGAVTAAKAERAIARGEVVAIAIHGRGFTVSRQGEALENGAVGQWIRVRPTGDKRDPVRARVIEPGKVGLDLP